MKGELRGFCFRRGVPGTCELHQLVGDETGRPVFVLNHLMEVAGVGEYDAFGHRNRITVAGVETQHPASKDVKLGSFERPQRGVLDVQMRVLVSHLDWGSNPWAQPSVVAGQDNGNDHAGAINAVPLSGGTPFLRRDWVAGTMLQVDYLANGQETAGAVVDAIEFDRVHRETTPYFPPMRWPGQYYDEETDLFENWNRYYDPRGGGYLSPEPLLQEPSYVATIAESGMSVASYSYALDNPLRYVDPTGLWALVLYGDPRIPGRNFSMDRPQIATAVQNFALPLTHEKDTSTVVPIDLSAGADEGAFSVGPDGKPWDTVVYVGHGTPSELLPGGPTAIDGSKFAALFGKVGPRNTRIVACNAGGKGAPFRTAVEKTWGPRSAVSGYNRLIEFNWAISGGKSTGGLFPAITGGQITGVTVW